MNQSLEELADAADRALAAMTTRRTFEEARAALNEAGMLKARNKLWESLATIDSRQRIVREQQAVVQQTGAALDQAIAEAEWELDARFVAEGNKTYLVDGDERRQMTADQRKQWKQLEALKQPSVAAAQTAHRAALFDLDACKDSAVLAEKAFQAAKADLDAAVATVGVLAASIRKENNR